MAEPAQVWEQLGVPGRTSIAGVDSVGGRTAPSVARRGAGRLLPARLGEYELFDHIGRGGMADIYRARKVGELGIERNLVVKEVLPELAQSERLATLLASEAKTASKLDHSNVVRIEDLQQDSGTLFIAMEYVDGLDLRELLRRASRRGDWVPPAIALRIVVELLRALEYAHTFQFGEDAIGIVHRDVSPSNVLLSFEGEVKLCDFGIAKSYDGAEDDAILEGMVEGKAGYMSPEQARGETLDPRADVFAAGIILWELVSRKKLYRASKDETLFDVARRADVPPLEPHVELPRAAELRSIAAKALARDRADRYGSAAEMQRALEAYVSRAGLFASPLKLRSFLEEGFAASIHAARKRRELATRALSMGPVAEVAALELPSPVVVATPTPKARVAAEKEARPTSTAVTRERRSIFPVVVGLALLLAAVLFAVLR